MVKGRVKQQLDVSKIESFVMTEMGRHEITGASYNPRKIADKNYKKLKGNLEKNGLVMPIVVNKRTGNIVSGHQRIKVLDELSISIDYKLNVALIDVDEKKEKELNVFLNNQYAMGEFDFEALGNFYKQGEDLEKMGFDSGDIYDIFGQNPLALETKELEDMAKKLQELKDMDKKLRVKGYNEDLPFDFYLVLVFKDSKVRKELLDYMGADDVTFQDGKYFKQMLMGEEVNE